MRASCSQCGAGLQVQRRDFYLRCPYCDARLLLDPGGRRFMISAPTVGEDSIAAAHSDMKLDSVEMVFFPYLETPGRGLEAFFSQPVPELDGYSPPSSSMKVLSPDDASPDQLIPPRDGQTPGTIVFHPFFKVSVSNRGFPEVFLVDAVSGLPPARTRGVRSAVPRPSRSFVEVLVPLLVISAAAFLLAGLAGAGIQDRLAASVAASLLGGGLLLRYRILGPE